MANRSFLLWCRATPLAVETISLLAALALLAGTCVVTGLAWGESSDPARVALGLACGAWAACAGFVLYGVAQKYKETVLVYRGVRVSVEKGIAVIYSNRLYRPVGRGPMYWAGSREGSVDESLIVDIDKIIRTIDVTVGRWTQLYPERQRVMTALRGIHVEYKVAVWTHYKKELIRVMGYVAGKLVRVQVTKLNENDALGHKLCHVCFTALQLK